MLAWRKTSKKEQRSNSYRTHIRDIDKRSTARESCFYECVCAYAPAYYRKTHGCFTTHSLARSSSSRSLSHSGWHTQRNGKVDQRTIFSVSIRRRCRCWWAKLQRESKNSTHERPRSRGRTDRDRKKCWLRLWFGCENFGILRRRSRSTHTNSNHDTYANQRTGTTFQKWLSIELRNFQSNIHDSSSHRQFHLKHFLLALIKRCGKSINFKIRLIVANLQYAWNIHWYQQFAPKKYKRFTTPKTINHINKDNERKQKKTPALVTFFIFRFALGW